MEEHQKTVNELQTWQKELLDERLKDYYQNPEFVFDFYELLDKIDKNLD